MCKGLKIIYNMLNDSFRILDANLNRASEGIRVIEDIFRFIYEDENISNELRLLRHKIRKSLKNFNEKFLTKRSSLFDVGLKNSNKKEGLDKKNNINELIYANFKRVEEALRCIEENLKIEKLHKLSKLYEELRFDVYNIEKEVTIFKSLDAKKKKITGIYAISGEEFSCMRDNVYVAEEILKAGVKVFQYREKEKKMLYKYEQAKKIKALCNKYDALFIMNDDIDLAILVGADGVHIGQEDIPIKEVRKLVGDNMIIGVSTHSPKEADRAVKEGADYIGVGPIFKTKTKKDVIDPVGLKYLDYVVKNIKIPFVAIGGIKEHNILETKKRGAKCFAMITEIVGAKDIQSKINKIYNLLNETSTHNVFY